MNSPGRGAATRYSTSTGCSLPRATTWPIFRSPSRSTKAAGAWSILSTRSGARPTGIIDVRHSLSPTSSWRRPGSSLPFQTRPPFRINRKPLSMRATSPAARSPSSQTAISSGENNNVSPAMDGGPSAEGQPGDRWDVSSRRPGGRRRVPTPTAATGLVYPPQSRMRLSCLTRRRSTIPAFAPFSLFPLPPARTSYRGSAARTRRAVCASAAICVFSSSKLANFFRGG